jgi:precorrin-2 dehydrogenase
MRYYPIFLDLENAPCLVIGGGQVGERKVKTLRSCGANIYLISRELTPFLKKEIIRKKISLLAPSYQAKYLQKMSLVIAATDDPDLNRAIGREARKRGILCNIVDDPEMCSFILPSLVVRGDLIVAISTAGKSPALARKIRQDLETKFPEIYGPYLELLGRIRTEVLARGMTQKKNKEIFEALVHSSLLGWLASGDLESFYQFMDRLINPPFPRPQLSKMFNNSSLPVSEDL